MLARVRSLRKLEFQGIRALIGFQSEKGHILFCQRKGKEKKMGLNVINLNEGHGGERRLWTVRPLTSVSLVK